MPFDPLQNFVYGQVATAPSPANSGTSLVLQAGQGTRFPDPATVGAYNAVIKPQGQIPTPDNAEIVRITAKSTDTLTITRTQESSSARTITVGDEVYGMAVTKKMIKDIQDATQMSIVEREVPTGSVNGSNTAFTLANTPASGSEKVYLNGLLQNVGGSNDYTISGNTITFTTAPSTGDVILVSYGFSTATFVAPTESFVTNELVNETPNGSTTAFTVDNAFISGSEQVYRDGQLMRGGGEDYTATHGTGTITFTTAPVTGSVILVSYRKSNVSGSGNADTLDGLHASDLIGGWNSTSATISYSSVDDPTGVLSTSIDLTGSISVGMRIKFTNGGNTIYGIVTAITSSTITFLHEIDPTDSLALVLLANSAVTNFRYSSLKAPYGFPLDPRKWSRQVKDTASLKTTNTANTWLNLSGLSLAIPIGAWDVSYSQPLDQASGGSTYIQVLSTLSTTNNGETDTEFTAITYGYATSDGGHHVMRKFLSLTAKTIYYLNAKFNAGAATTGAVASNTTPALIRITSAYL